MITITAIASAKKKSTFIHLLLIISIIIPTTGERKQIEKKITLNKSKSSNNWDTKTADEEPRIRVWFASPPRPPPPSRFPGSARLTVQDLRSTAGFLFASSFPRRLCGLFPLLLVLFSGFLLWWSFSFAPPSLAPLLPSSSLRDSCLLAWESQRRNRKGCFGAGILRRPTFSLFFAPFLCLSCFSCNFVKIFFLFI